MSRGKIFYEWGTFLRKPTMTVIRPGCDVVLGRMMWCTKTLHRDAAAMRCEMGMEEVRPASTGRS